MEDSVDIVITSKGYLIAVETARLAIIIMFVLQYLSHCQGMRIDHGNVLSPNIGEGIYPIINTEQFFGCKCCINTLEQVNVINLSSV